MESSEKTCRVCGQSFPRTREFFYAHATKDGLRNECKHCRNVACKENATKDPERHRAYARKSAAKQREKNREVVYERTREWKARNPDNQRQWWLNHKKEAIVYKRNRQTKLRNLPTNFTVKDWEYALEYFGHCCAVCGRRAGLWHTLAADHWIPVNDPRVDNPGTVPHNIVPLCHQSGGCNNKKRDHDPEEWLIATFGKRKAKQILKRIHDYFDHVRSRQLEQLNDWHTYLD